MTLTVLYDENCGICQTARHFLDSRAQLVPLEFVAAGSDEARRRYPTLEHSQTLKEITVIGDDGAIYVDDSGWLMCLWALDGYRGLAARLSQPHLRPLARRVVAATAGVRNYGEACGAECQR